MESPRWAATGLINMSVFVKPDAQNQTCLSYAMARKRLFYRTQSGGYCRKSVLDLRLSPRGDVEAGLLVFVLDVDMASALLVEQHLSER